MKLTRVASKSGHSSVYSPPRSMVSLPGDKEHEMLVILPAYVLRGRALEQLPN